MSRRSFHVLKSDRSEGRSLRWASELTQLSRFFRLEVREPIVSLCVTPIQRALSVNSSVTTAAPARSGNESAVSTVSRWIRRVHMYTGLFLAPWMLMYAFSTLVMTHREYVLSFYSSKNPAMTTEHELDYSRTFPTNITREEISAHILQDIGLDGAHFVSGGRNGQPLVVNRQHALGLRRVTFDPTMHKITIQREEFRALTFLERMHRRRGYSQPYTLDDTWGFTVDAAVVAMVFWSLSGIWLWWEIRMTRFWGALSLVAGLSLFILFIALI